MNVVGLLFFVIYNVQAQYGSPSQYESCFTPKKMPGQCVSIRNCPELIQLLQLRPLTTEAAAYLKSAHCGFEGLDAKVCCSLNNQDNGDRGFSQVRPPNEIKTTTEERKSVPPRASLDTSILPDKSECGLSTGSDRIVGGLPADIFDFPWMCLIEYARPVGTGFYCGGSLISKRYVLTAAHCLKGKDLPSTWNIIRVRLGEYNLETDRDCISSQSQVPTCSDPPVNVPVSEQIAHEYYNPNDVNQYNDIALLRLARDVTFTDFIKPICLPAFDDIIRTSFVGINATVSGWGKTSESGSESAIKLKVNVPVKVNRECETVYESRGVTVSNSQLCAGGEVGRDSCRGDSGGPLMNIYTAPGEINWYITGIVSFGPSKCGLAGWPGIYTKVTEYIPWILQHMRP